MTEAETQTQTPRRAQALPRATGRRDRRGDERRGAGARPGRPRSSRGQVAGGQAGEAPPGACLAAACLPPSQPLRLMGGRYHLAARPLECAVSSPHGWGAGARGGGLGGGSDRHGEAQARELGWPRAQTSPEGHRLTLVGTRPTLDPAI